MPPIRPHSMRLDPLRTALALALACAPGAVEASSPNALTVLVANCNDSGAGSLRDAVTNASDGDTIDASQLGCSRISLTTGAIVLGVDNLTVLGPGPTGLTIDGRYNNGEDIFFHLGTGTLNVDSMTLSGGRKYRTDLPAQGGCIYSMGNVALNEAVLADCQAHGIGVDNVAHGGAVYTQQDLTMIDSVISGSLATNPDADSRGGGAYVKGSLIAKYSTIADNQAKTVYYPHGSLGGGLFVYRQAVIINSTISGNYAWHMGGMFAGAGASYPVEIDNSTITDNRASRVGRRVRIRQHQVAEQHDRVQSRAGTDIRRCRRSRAARAGIDARHGKLDHREQYEFVWRIKV